VFGSGDESSPIVGKLSPNFQRYRTASKKIDYGRLDYDREMALQSIDPKEFITIEGTPKMGVVKQ
tara:strand:- start:21 stop:215 length:195 start_codon:yes stop_codon:yes gene_type:complete